MVDKKTKSKTTPKDLYKTENILPSNIKKYSESNKGINLLTNSLYVTIFFFIIATIYVGSIIYYLVKLKECPCFLEKNKENNSNISYLILIESLIIAVYIIIILSLIYLTYVLNNKKIGGGSKIIAYYISFLVMLIIYGFFIYYVFKLSENISEDCNCSKSWIRYLLYIQTVIMIISIFMNSYNLIKLT